MTWEKIGQIYQRSANKLEMSSFTAVPFVGEITGSLAQIFYSTRDSNNKSSVNCFLFDLDKLSVEKEYSFSFFSPGVRGGFDEDGVMGCHLTRVGTEDYLYYIGWNKAISIPFRNAIGIAKLKGTRFERIYDGPVLDRSIYDPCFVASNCVIQIGKDYIMYYLSCIKWEEVDDRLVHHYHIKIAVSSDGLKWDPTGKIAIDFLYSNEFAISTPRVIFECGIYKMWYSYRGGPFSNKYRIGYAESKDGFNWMRKDEEVGIDISKSGWDSEMICYPYVFDYNDKKYMLYNGNHYGQTGIGLAIYNT